jgi:hypothetical protein
MYYQRRKSNIFLPPTGIHRSLGPIPPTFFACRFHKKTRFRGFFRSLYLTPAPLRRVIWNERTRNLLAGFHSVK